MNYNALCKVQIYHGGWDTQIHIIWIQHNKNNPDKHRHLLQVLKHMTKCKISHKN